MSEKVELWSKHKLVLGYICFPLIQVSLLFQRLISVFIPVKANRIAVYRHNRRGYSCNPKYIVEELLSTDSRKYEIFWITKYPETCKELGTKGVKVVKTRTLSDFLVRLTSKVIISGDNFDFLFIKRKNQLYIDTWHGAINYKRIGYRSLSFPSKIQEVYYHMRNRQPDLYVAGSEFFLHDTAKSFNFDESIFLPIGLPRNDLFFKQQLGLSEQVRKKLGILSGYMVLLYAPTFRQGIAVSDFGIAFTELAKKLEEKYYRPWVILFRSHYFIDKKLESTNSNMLDVSQYYDMQELLYVSDILVSDYSSCMWDFSLTGKPCFVFAPDLGNYVKNDRGFAYPLDKWPYPIAKSNQELLDNIDRFDEKTYKQKLAEHHNGAGSYDCGIATKKLVEIIEGHCFSKK